MKPISLSKTTKVAARRWTIGIAIVTMISATSLFAFLFFKVSERDILSIANAIVSAYRTDILSGDVRSVELQLNRIFNTTSADKFIFLDSQKSIWVEKLNPIKIIECKHSEGICRDFLKGRITADLPIFYDNEKTSLWGYLHIETRPTVHWQIIFFISASILLGMLLLAFCLYTQFLKSVNLVSATTSNWALLLSQDPKNSGAFGKVPFSELEPIALSLSGLNSEIALLEAAAMEQGSLNTLRAIGHDILNPVSRMKRLLGLLDLKKGSQPHYDPEIISNLAANLKRLSGYAEQLKSLYKRNTGEKVLSSASIDVSKELIAIVNELGDDPDKIRKRICFETDLKPDCFINIQPSIIARIVENLLLNSCHASAEGTTVLVKSYKERDRVHLEIKDVGSGIPIEFGSKIFDPHFSTKPNKGTGLGLFVVKQLCEQNQGSISFTSVVGEGTSFDISFPKAEPML